MDLRQLRYFVAVVEARSFSRAAERVHVAQSALSSRIRELEQRLGVALLNRHPRGVSTTPAGEKLHAYGKQILKLLRQAERDVQSASGEAIAPVLIGIPAGVGRVLNSALLEACANELPHVSLRVVEVLPSHAIDWLDAGLIQLAVTYDIDQACDSAALAEEELYLVCGAAEQNLGSSVGLRDLPHYPLVLPVCSHNPQQCVATRTKAVGVELNIERRVDSLTTILDLVTGRAARTILTPGAFMSEWQAGKVFAYPIEPRMKRSVKLRLEAAAIDNPAVRAVEKIVRGVARKLTAEGAWPRTLPGVAASARG